MNQNPPITAKGSVARDEQRFIDPSEREIQENEDHEQRKRHDDFCFRLNR